MKKLKGLTLVLVTVLLLGGLNPTSTVQAQTPGLASDWQYRSPVTVTNNGSALTDYQVLITLDTAFDFVTAAADGADVRITAADGVTLLPFWIETWDSVGETARIWVKVDALPAGNSTLYLYYGNSGASSASDGASTFVFFDDFESFGASHSMNAVTHLTIPTYDGSGQVVHPDVMYLSSGWNGYAYWMAMTPSPYLDESYENPSILVSSDGLTWVEPTGITNPIVDLPSAGHNADPDILLVGDTLMVYYSETTGDTPDDHVYINVLTSTNGITWTAPVTTLSFSIGTGGYALSPAVLYEGGTFYMWYVRSAGCTANTSSVYMRTSTNGLNWGVEQPVTLTHPGQVVWHPDVQWNGSTYVMLYAAYPAGSDCTDTSLYYAESADREEWTTTTTPVLTPNPSGWDSSLIYRSTFLADGDSLRIWYSAQALTLEWHIGYTAGDLNDFLSAQTQLWDTVTGDTTATTDHARSGSYGLRQGGGSVYPSVTKAITGNISFNAWLYDNMITDTNYLAVLRVWDPGNVTYPMHAIGIGVLPWQDEDYYIYHTEGWGYNTSGQARSSGWHRLAINVRATTSDLLVDGNVIASLDVLDEGNISMISLEGFLDGVGYFDDAYVRQYVDSEPTVTVGPGEPNAVTVTSFKARSSAGLIEPVHKVVEWVKSLGGMFDHSPHAVMRPPYVYLPTVMRR